MKRMQLTFCNGEDAPKMGKRLIPDDTEVLSDKRWYAKASSDEIAALFCSEIKKGRTSWVQLIIELDDIPLYFWLPSELDHVCDVFAMKPFPTALTLAKQSSIELWLNNHWLSRLPKAAKSPRYRQRFLKYVASSPPELQTFRDFYN